MGKKMEIGFGILRYATGTQVYLPSSKDDRANPQMLNNRSS